MFRLLLRPHLLAADLPYFMLTLHKLWTVQWVWPITAYVFILYSEIWTNLSYGQPIIPRRPDKRGILATGLDCRNYYVLQNVYISWLLVMTHAKIIA